jgi:hypothetical protein
MEQVESSNRIVNLPTRFTDDTTSSFYEVSDLSQDQEPIVRVILSKIKEWIEVNRCDDLDKLNNFKPLRLTVRGMAGSGKSFIIKVVRTALMRVFGCNDPITIAAPTGSAAFNIGGETLHRIAEINVRNVNQTPSAARCKSMMKRFEHTVGIIIDERSLLSCDVLGATEKHVSKTMHGGTHENEDWGGLPIVVLIGDDYQLPPPTIQKGAFHTVADGLHSSMINMDNVVSNGCLQFRNFAKASMELTTSHRQDEDQSQFKGILARVRECNTNNVDARVLAEDHHLRNKAPGVAKEISKGALYLYSTRAKRDDHNLQKLCQESSALNPVAILKSKYCSNVGSKVFKSHFDVKNDVTPLLCRGCMVSIQGKNFNPKWGLYNGALGTIIDLHFRVGSNPNCGDLPEYVSVEFREYCGPVWDKIRPKVSTAK